MKKIALVVLAVMVTASFCYAADDVKVNEPMGAMADATGKFVGKVVSVATLGQADKAQGASQVTVADESGKAVVFVVDPAAKVVDATLNAITLKDLKAGEKVSVEYSKDKEGAEKAKAINVVK